MPNEISRFCFIKKCDSVRRCRVSCVLVEQWGIEIKEKLKSRLVENVRKLIKLWNVSKYATEINTINKAQKDVSLALTPARWLMAFVIEIYGIKTTKQLKFKIIIVNFIFIN